MLLLLAHSHFSPQSQERNWERLEVRKRDERETVGEASRSFSSLGCTSLSLSLSSHPNISPLISEIDRRDRGVGMKIRTRERDKRLHSSPFVCVMSLEMTRRGRERRRDMCEWKGRTCLLRSVFDEVIVNRTDRSSLHSSPHSHIHPFPICLPFSSFVHN